MAFSPGKTSRFYGLLAQLVERFHGMEEVSGSIPLGSTTLKTASSAVFLFKSALLCGTVRVEINFHHFALEQNSMLWTIAVILIVLWLLGLVTSYTLGGFIHILLVIAVIVILIRLIRGENIF